MVAILMMSVKLATLGLLKRKVFWNKGYGIIISVHDITKKNYHVTQIILKIWLVMWPESANSSLSMKKIIITTIL